MEACDERLYTAVNMFERILTAVFGLITAFISWGHYWSIGLLMAIESACIPLPSEIIMPFAGYLVHTGELNLLLVATAGAIGCNVGSIPAYWVGAHGGRPMVERFGRYVLLSGHDLDLVQRYFEKYGSITVLVGRLLPVVRTFIALPAGIAKMNLVRFHLYTFLGSWPWCYLLAYVGMKLGDKWQTDPRFKAMFHKFHLGVEIALVAGVVWFVASHWKNRVGAQAA